MTSTHLLQWIEHPETLNKESLYELRTLLARYPYFQSLRLLYLKNLYLLHDVTFGEELRKSVFFIADRRVLFYQIEGEHYALRPQQPLLSASSESESDADKDRTLYLIDSFLSTVPEEQPQTTELDYAMDYTAFLLQPDEADESAAETGEVPKLRGQSLIDDFLSKADEPTWSIGEEKMELASQSQEVMLPEEKPEDREGVDILSEEVQVEADEPLETASEDEEIQEETVTPADTSEKELIEEEENGVEIPLEEETFTETLAKIYIKQHRYDKALEIIKKLSLNYPKKNAYFADQIRFLEKLIINAKSK